MTHTQKNKDTIGLIASTIHHGFLYGLKYAEEENARTAINNLETIPHACLRLALNGVDVGEDYQNSVLYDIHKAAIHAIGQLHDDGADGAWYVQKLQEFLPRLDKLMAENGLQKLLNKDGSFRLYAETDPLAKAA